VWGRKLMFSELMRVLCLKFEEKVLSLQFKTELGPRVGFMPIFI
jgi:hypothetical protein